jgi:2'-5' RNA ligase
MRAAEVGAGGARSDRARLFVGVAVSAETANAIAAAAGDLRAAAERAGVPVRWVSPAAYHVTLKFLGWARREVIGAIDDAVGAALTGERAFQLIVRGAGAFPRADRARVLWVGVSDPGGALARSAAAVERALAPLGFAPEGRPFHAHITVGRTERVADAGALLLPWSERTFSTTRVDAVSLYESSGNTKVSGYPSRLRWPLGAVPQRSRRQTGPVRQDDDDEPGLSGQAARDDEEQDDGAADTR